MTLFLSIRSFDTQLPSAYVQELRYMPPIAGGFDNVKRRVLKRPPSWFELVRRIRAAAPGIPLRVWRQEDYRAEHRGDPRGADRDSASSGRCRRSADPAWTKSPSLEAIRAVEALPAMPEPERRERARAIFGADAGEGPRFQPFDRRGARGPAGGLRRRPRADRRARPEDPAAVLSPRPDPPTGRPAPRAGARAPLQG